MKEMEAIVESEFAEVFVPLLMGLASYQDIFSVMKAKKDGQSTNLKPFQVATESLQVRFLLVILHSTVWKLRKFTLTLFWQKFRENNDFTNKITK